ncbi:alpha/beta fold hydrolase [Streptomyces zingiberis]|uniref:Alpha/beta hydrolase n=1 Tax=Streptomyces zingiberis TaxID=2053010 RepID=A0ABX1C8J1_9ACTN|nr:alpha/beta hydrolase [Streptomyces zingiberis]NJQ03259.1 alpha/beta hydrolase [Streptomyces zingiberis]
MAQTTAGDPASGAALDAAAAAVDAAAAAAGRRGWRRAGLAGTALGVVAAGAAAGVALERFTVHRGMRRTARLALDTAGPYGTLRGTPGEAVADDGTVLRYEVHEIHEIREGRESRGAHPPRHPEPFRTPGTAGTAGRPGVAGDPGPAGTRQTPGAPGTPPPPGAPATSRRPRRSRRPFGRRAPAPLTVVFCHGYCLNQDSWHFQREALHGAVRTVFWDQRSHGRSRRGVAQAEGVPLTIDQLGRDLRAVLDAAAPEGPVVLVGHSMGGMTVMALAAHDPEYVRERVAGVALVGTSAGGLAEIDFGLPVAGVNAVRRILPGVFRALVSRVDLVERGRRVTADLFAGIVERYSFGSRNVDPAITRFAERMIESTPIDVVAEFYPAFQEHDKAEALAAFAELPVLVIVGDRDLVTPGSHSDAIVAALPGAELVIVPDAGHLVMLEHPETVNARLAELISRADAAPPARRRRAPRAPRLPRPSRPVQG